ncbi:MAG: hypothetical protein JRI70_04995 [Deltaproteobacteria bacterium]|nr:hypothetical protein [Deltaproteobacteria bacterium]
MYLAQRTIKGKRHYFIRESYKDGDLFRSRELFGLGTNLAKYVIYPGGRAFYIDEVVEDRRIHYLRSGRMDQGGLGRMHLKLYVWLSAKSRDEIEQRFMRMERHLDPSELKNYTFVIFDLQRFFTQSWAKRIPQGLSQEKMYSHFMELGFFFLGRRRNWRFPTRILEALRCDVF